MKLYNKDYQCKINADGVTFTIGGSDGSEYRDQSFYKYYALSKNSVDALTHLYIYASHPSQFNDPLDCAADLITFDDINSIKNLWNSLYPEMSELCHSDIQSIEYFSNAAYKTILYLKWGVLCLSKVNDDLSMWSAYCNHKGFCLEFDIAKFPFKTTGPFPINYQEKLKSCSIRNTSVQLATIVQTNVKRKCWEHEKEWRLLIEAPKDFYLEPFGVMAASLKNNMSGFHDRKFKYPVRCLKSICLGVDFFHGIHYVVTNYEIEYIAEDTLQNDVLAFLARTKIPTYVLGVFGLDVIKRRIEVIQIRQNAYRIVYL